MEPLDCANRSQLNNNITCHNPGMKACAGCHLVLYCSKECQTVHWPIHKLDCKSPLRKQTWRPAWELENRTPDFIDSDTSNILTANISHGGRKYLWGNVPALDLLQLKDNEGENTSQELSLLLAASGDLRNLVKTIASLPDGYTGHLHVDINDKDETVVARNLILLLVAFNFPPEMASTMMLHLWYSAFLPSSLMQSLQSKVFPVIQNFLKSKSSESSVSLEGTWSHNKATLSAMLPREEWEKVLSYFRGTSNISFDDAVAVRKSVTLAPSRRDYVDRAIFRLPPSWRLCQQKFRGDGVLLPFGASRESFMVPAQSTFFQDNPSWPMPDSADPLDGWKLSEVLQATYPAKNDLYGQLYLHIRQDLLKFCQRLTTLKLSIYALQVNAVQLPGHISRLRGGKQLYDRIGLANIADRAYLGAVDTLSTFGPLLKPKTQNPKATLLTLFLNATHEMCTLADQKASFTRSIGTLQKFLPINPQTILKGNTLSAESLAFMNAYSMFIDGDTIFNRFVNVAGLKKLGDSLGLGMKSTQTIVAKWPMRLNENPTQREFEMLYWSGHVGSERYVEWHRTR